MFVIGSRSLTVSPLTSETDYFKYRALQELSTTTPDSSSFKKIQLRKQSTSHGLYVVFYNFSTSATFYMQKTKVVNKSLIENKPMCTILDLLLATHYKIKDIQRRN